MPLTQFEIRGAVNCPAWQEIRKSLKRRSTQYKLDRLLLYVKPLAWNSADYKAAKECCDYEKRCIQVLNYLYALSRAQQIDVIPQRWSFKDTVQEFLERKEYRILK